MYTKQMISSIRNVAPKKKKRGRPRVDAADIMVAVPPPLLAELDAFRQGLPDKPGRPEGIRRLMKLGLVSESAAPAKPRRPAKRQP
jgi:hypothetical protein